MRRVLPGPVHLMDTAEHGGGPERDVDEVLVGQGRRLEDLAGPGGVPPDVVPDHHRRRTVEVVLSKSNNYVLPDARRLSGETLLLRGKLPARADWRS